MTEHAPAKTGEYPSDIPKFPKVQDFKFAIKINVKVAERFAFVAEEEISMLVDKGYKKTPKKSPSYAVNVFDGKQFVNESRVLRKIFEG